MTIYFQPSLASSQRFVFFGKKENKKQSLQNLIYQIIHKVDPKKLQTCTDKINTANTEEVIESAKTKIKDTIGPKATSVVKEAVNGNLTKFQQEVAVKIDNVTKVIKENFGSKAEEHFKKFTSILNNLLDTAAQSVIMAPFVVPSVLDQAKTTVNNNTDQIVSLIETEQNKRKEEQNTAINNDNILKDLINAIKSKSGEGFDKIKTTLYGDSNSANLMQQLLNKLSQEGAENTLENGDKAAKNPEDQENQ